MQHFSLRYDAWARDFGLLGATAGVLAPLFVIFDPIFSIAAGLLGGLGGVAVGTVAGRAVGWLRRSVPLPVMVALMAAVGSLWGAAAGGFGGVVTALFGPSWFGLDTPILGFIVGGTTGMVATGLFFPAYLFLSVRRQRVWPLVATSMLVTPALGWAGIVALGVSIFGGWLFALPALVWGAVVIDRSHQRRLLGAKAKRLTLGNALV